MKGGRGREEAEEIESFESEVERGESWIVMGIKGEEGRRRGDEGKVRKSKYQRCCINGVGKNVISSFNIFLPFFIVPLSEPSYYLHLLTCFLGPLFSYSILF